MSIRIYSDGKRIAGIESVIGYNLQNPMEFWFEGIEKPIYILSELDEFTDGQKDAYSDAETLIEDHPGFTGDTYCMGPDHMKRYIDKHFIPIAFSKGEHGLSWYYVGKSHGWDYGTAGYFLLPRDEWSAADANNLAVGCKELMRYMTAWANGDEYATYEFYIEDGQLEYENYYGFYGEDDALNEACVNGFKFIGEFSADDQDGIFDALVKNFPDRYGYVTRKKHVPMRIIPAHDETWEEFAVLQ